MIKAVVFDIDGVLLDSFEANFKFYNDVFIKIGYPKMTKEEYLPLFPATMLKIIMVKTKLDEEKAKNFWMTARKDVRFPVALLSAPGGMEETVQVLSKTYDLGIVTGRLHEFIDRMPQLKPLMSCFKSVVGFDDTKEHKPDPEPLLLACKQLNVDPSETVYIGDAASDVECARKAGAKVVVFNYPIVEQPKGADAYFSEFGQLSSLISSI